ncbi:MAG: hypothetical protein KAW00_06795 [Dehalococcoidia bacterium]|nr:hypothetical protein [Dehalococcoidia bacterium]
MSGTTEPTTTEPELGYGCICGFKTTDKVKFTSHVMFSAQKDGRGTHKSLGRVDMETGEVVLPPFAERTDEQKKQARHKVSTNGGDESGGGGGTGGGGAGGGGTGKTPIVQSTSHIAEASQIRAVPKIFTMDYTPIMRVAQDAAVKYFGWRPDMPFENFVDTVLYYYFLEKGITLMGYVVDDSLLPKEEDTNGH